MNIFRRARLIHILRRYPIDHTLWEEVTRGLHLLDGLTAVEKARLQELSTVLLYGKSIVGGRDLHITDAMRVTIAAQVCLPILELGIELLRGWSEIIVYPNAFRVNQDEIDEFGIVHRGERFLSGESWSQGPVILSWRDIEMDLEAWERGCNVIVHEIAHKLDMLNGSDNGMPPLNAGMEAATWTSVFSQAYRQLKRSLEQGFQVPISPYAATSPAEFFAVVSEAFFCAPETLNNHFAEVYRQLRQYYRQDPLGRIV